MLFCTYLSPHFPQEQTQADSEISVAQVHGQNPTTSCLGSAQASGPHVEGLILPLRSIWDPQGIVAPPQTPSLVLFVFPNSLRASSGLQQ